MAPGLVSPALMVGTGASLQSEGSLVNLGRNFEQLRCRFVYEVVPDCSKAGAMTLAAGGDVLMLRGFPTCTTGACAPWSLGFREAQIVL